MRDPKIDLSGTQPIYAHLVRLVKCVISETLIFKAFIFPLFITHKTKFLQDVEPS